MEEAQLTGIRVFAEGDSRILTNVSSRKFLSVPFRASERVGDVQWQVSSNCAFSDDRDMKSVL